jgi:hypothetical protein
VGGTRELATHNVHALIVPRRDPAALAEAIEATLNDPGATAQRTANGRRRVETELSFESRTRQLAATYEKLTQSCHRRSGASSSIHSETLRALPELSVRSISQVHGTAAESE